MSMQTLPVLAAGREMRRFADSMREIALVRTGFYRGVAKLVKAPHFDCGITDVRIVPPLPFFLPL